jgi:hypothetical protein
MSDLDNTGVSRLQSDISEELIHVDQHLNPDDGSQYTGQVKKEEYLASN